MRVPPWLPTSALVGMLVFLVGYSALFFGYIFTGDDSWLMAAFMFMIAYWVFTVFHIMYVRRRRQR